VVFCGRPVYRYYLDHPNPFQVSPLDDQVLGAVIMWVIGSLVFLVRAMLIAFELAGLGEGSRVEKTCLCAQPAEDRSHGSL
jgi:cytochrome c oxidase assembly factor CtaG